MTAPSPKALAAEIAAFCDEIERSDGGRSPQIEMMRKAEAALRSVSVLEEALKPFAEFAEVVATERPGWDHDAFVIFSPPSSTDQREHLAMAPFRRARSLARQDASTREGEHGQ